MSSSSFRLRTGKSPDHRFPGRTEAMVGLTFAVVDAVVFAGFGVWLAFAAARHAGPGFRLYAALLTLLGWLPVLVVEVRTVRWIDGVLDRRPPKPIPVSIAVTHRRWPPPLKPLVATWWLVHAAALIYLAHWIVAAVHFAHPSDFTNVFKDLLAFWVVFGSAYAANTYFLLATAAVNPTHAAVAAVWRWRVGIDLAVAALFPLLVHVAPDFGHGWW